MKQKTNQIHFILVGEEDMKKKLYQPKMFNLENHINSKRISGRF